MDDTKKDWREKGTNPFGRDFTAITPYAEIDHYHCFEEKKPPCGQKIEHYKCCLCEMLNPKIAHLLTIQREEILKEIEALKNEEDTEGRGWTLFFHGEKGTENNHCCAGDDFGIVYEKALTDLTTRLREKI